MAENKLEEQINSIKEQLERLSQAEIPAYLDEAFEVRRVQVLRGGKWGTGGYEIQLGTGPVDIHLKTRECEVEGRWGADVVRKKVNPMACDVINDYLDFTIKG